MNAPESFTRTSVTEDRRERLSAYQAVRQATVALAAPLSAEDCQAQSMPDASPVKWHLAHTTWFFETFLLSAFAPDYEAQHPEYRVIFNSYYNAVGKKHPRPQRGLLTRPTLAQVLAYRQAVDEAMAALISGRARLGGDAHEFDGLLTLGLNHEQQHQELILTDLKHLLSCNPVGPAYLPQGEPSGLVPAPMVPAGADAGAGAVASGGGRPERAERAFVRFDGGILAIGNDGEGFGFDNEGPAHSVLLQPFELCDRLVTCGEYLDFIEAGGYDQPEHWLSLGWDTVQAGDWRLPIYWRRAGETDEGPAEASGSAGLEEFTLRGWQPLDLAAPVSHLSYFEADAFARWSGHRLPSEFEWEHAARHVQVAAGDNLLEQGLLRPMPASTPARPPVLAGSAGSAGPARPAQSAPTGNDGAAAAGADRLKQLWGDLWEWTASPYVPYPGFKTSPGAVGEYNGKFMCNQYVLRGGSFATSRSHIRASYRNFFPPDARWQFTGVRLARDGTQSVAASPKG